MWTRWPDSWAEVVRAATPSTTERMFITLKPHAQRKSSADQVINRLRPKLARVPGVNALPQASPGRACRQRRG